MTKTNPFEKFKAAKKSRIEFSSSSEDNDDDYDESSMFGMALKEHKQGAKSATTTTAKPPRPSKAPGLLMHKMKRKAPSSLALSGAQGSRYATALGKKDQLQATTSSGVTTASKFGSIRKTFVSTNDKLSATTTQKSRNGWISKSKTPAEIQQAAARAKAARSKVRTKKKQPSANVKRKTSFKSTKKRNSRKKIDSEEEEDLSDGFIVGDDEDEEEDYVSFQSASEEEMDDAMLDESCSSDDDNSSDSDGEEKKVEYGKNNGVSRKRDANDKKKNKFSANVSPFFAKKQERRGQNGSACTSSRIKEKTVKIVDIVSDDDDGVGGGLGLMDTPPPVKKSKKKSKIESRGDEAIDLLGSCDDDFASPQEKSEYQKAVQLSMLSDNDSQDSLSPEERKAIRKAEKLSLKSLKKNNSSGQNKQKPQKKVIEFLSDDEESMQASEGENDDEVDCFEEEEDEESKEAGSVLKTTNKLSKFIVAQMTQWCSSENDTKDARKPMSGMLVADGAMSAGSVSATNGDANKGVADELKEGISFSSSPRWIPRDEIERTCPGLRLADYQLIGVNWLALLSTLTYEVEEKKGKCRVSNVNGVLADEMGLGKTVQTIAFLAWLRQKRMHGQVMKNKDTAKRAENLLKVDEDSNKRRRIVADSSGEESDDDDGPSYEPTQMRTGDVVDMTIESDGTTPPCSPIKSEVRPHLIIVPASVLNNWMNEFEKFCPDMTVVKYHGSVAERRDIQDRLRMSLPSSKRRIPLDIVLTTFSYFSSEKADDRNFLRKMTFDYMVVDEAHCLKNPKGSRYRNMAKFRTSHRLLLTGTPVQNSPQELMSLLCFLMPLFKRQNNSDEEDDGGKKMLEHFVTLSKEAQNSAESTAFTKLKQLLAPFVLRRRKITVLSQLLPPKERTVEYVPFDESTRKVYDGILSAHLDRKNNGTAVKPFNAIFDNQACKNIFTQLRKAANHPLLLRTRHTSEKEIKHLSHQLLLNGYFGRDASCTIDLVRKELEQFSDFDVHCAALDLIEQNPHCRKEFERYCLQTDDLYSSPKLVRLRKMLPALINEGHRILIFSQWTSCLDLIGCFLESLEYNNFLRLDGQTDIKDRQNLIDKFNSDDSIPIFLLSTRAGGMGINLTAADTCIIHDLDFNPFNDLQAEDRCHRIGQKRPVTVIKLITEKTVDSDIYAMQERKAQMNAAILGEGDIKASGKPKSKTQEKKEEKESISTIMQNAMDRYLSSPAPMKKSADDIVEILSE